MQTNMGGQDKEFLDASKEQVKRLGGGMREHLLRSADRRIEAIAKEFDHIGEDLGQHEHGAEQPVSEYVAKFAGRAAEFVRGKKTADLVELGRKEVSERPGLLLAGLVGLGFLGARMIRR